MSQSQATEYYWEHYVFLCNAVKKDAKLVIFNEMRLVNLVRCIACENQKWDI